MTHGIDIRQADVGDREGIWQIISEVISRGDSYVFEPGTSKEKLLSYWCGPDIHTYVAETDGRIAGTFVIKENQPGLGSHIANASYMTLTAAAGRGIGTAMGRFSIGEAKRLGFSAMQFNLVVKSNHVAVRLWKRLGFEVIGEIPEAFNHQTLGLTNAYIMYRKI